MSTRIPFLFCRYQLSVDDEVLDEKGQLEALKELQGKYYPHTKKAAESGLFDSVIMRPRNFQVAGNSALSWSVGQQIGQRVRARYDGGADKLLLEAQPDDSIKYSDFVAIPSLRVLAVDDRTGDRHLGGRGATNRFKSVFRQLDGADCDIVLATDRADVDRALDKWDVHSFMFTVRPPNPHPPSEPGRILAERMKARGIGRATGKWESEADGSIKPKADDEMTGIIDLAEAGYGQIGLKGEVDGHDAQIKKPQYYHDPKHNIRAQDRPREMRVFIESDDDKDEAVFDAAAKALVNFYGNGV